MSVAGSFRLTRGSFVLEAELKLPERGVTALFGRSGSGKTTLLRCLAGLERSEGWLTVNGQRWQAPDHVLPVHRRPLGYVFQEASLFPHLRVRDNLRYGYRRVEPSRRRVDFDETVKLLGLEALLERHPQALSGGQRQRVAIARALLASPRLLLMDEPMASLDATSKAEILPYLERLHAHLEIPVVYVSHALDEVTRLADHMVLLEAGQVLAAGPLHELLVRSDLPLSHADNAAAVLETRVEGYDADRQLVALTCGAGRLWVSREAASPGKRLRLSIHASDVVISLTPPQDASVLNCLPAQVAEISDDPHPGHLLVRLAVAEQMLLSRIPREASQRLALHPGQQVYAQLRGKALS
ncbi:molybdenum ABC transporter ATP-binding protein [Halomonas sp. MCCC 1A17488]|uniref:molybdenum ABC transporter ATP-binding protein n=1 Tax=unclassified Halomonas TaxID=2609666 RepID=UPI0018D2124F|nr:molybdenum ABC transporter ATP-binding protein [Halomonas sp. SS10-MC5]MCE8018062.1 molybdenum ABC transporter ATP-binding protein [Halomonas sp. MCCC 1A17488]MCG3241395.1 molybdenum ABC transporter ATP-binding protein [Halomonas sp. MCCC 1A17488]QPP48642.1 molybdenum ABC transporter ATP-binding protein [Halomonas sp. SS10-MC5]